MEMYFHLTLSLACNYLAMSDRKLTHFSKGGPARRDDVSQIIEMFLNDSETLLLPLLLTWFNFNPSMDK